MSQLLHPKVDKTSPTPPTSSAGTTGFTLIELLMVVAIISLLSSIVLGKISSARAEADDARKIEDAHSAQIAFEEFSSNHNALPANYLTENGDGTLSFESSGNPSNSVIALEDTAYPNDPQDDTSNSSLAASGLAYNASMQELVNDGVLSAIPHSPDPSTPYGYYNYGTSSPIVQGAIFFTELTTVPPSTTGPANTCRPIPAATVQVSEPDENTEESRNNSACQGGPTAWNQACDGVTPGFMDGSSTCCYDYVYYDNNITCEATSFYNPSDQTSAISDTICTEPATSTSDVCDQSLSTDYCVCSQ